MFAAIRESVGDDIGKQFVQGQIDFKRLTFGNTTRLAECTHVLTKGIQLGQIVF